MRKKKKDFNYTFYGIFAGLGTFFVILGIIIGVVLTKERDGKIKIDATVNTIERDDDDHDVYVDYVYEGQLYERVYLNYYSSKMRIGRTVEIYIDPNDPYNISGDVSVALFVLSFSGLGAVFSLIGYIKVISTYKKKKRFTQLKAQGRRINGVVESLVPNRSVAINGANPYSAIVVVKDMITDEERRYQSEDFWPNMVEYIYEGVELPVYVDRENEDVYYVDINAV